LVVDGVKLQRAAQTKPEAPFPDKISLSRGSPAKIVSANPTATEATAQGRNEEKRRVPVLKFVHLKGNASRAARVNLEEMPRERKPRCPKPDARHQACKKTRIVKASYERITRERRERKKKATKQFEASEEKA
jgi:hypothetical protein